MENPTQSSTSFIASSTSTIEPEIDPNLNLEARLSPLLEKILDSKISKAINKVFIFILTVALAALTGMIITVSYDLNGKIYEAVGKQSVSKEISDSKIQNYEEQIKTLSTKLQHFECINDIKIKNKADCYKP